MADPSTYTVGWICALATELVAAKSFFDEEYKATLYTQVPGDDNIYSFGRMGDHDVVVASLPRSEYGIGPAASVARDMLRTFPNIRVGLMVGIGGGAPSPQHDIRLGDLVVSVPSGTRGGVLQHNRGKTVQQQDFQLTGSLNQPPRFLLAAVTSLEVDYEDQGHELNERIEAALSKRPRLKKRYARPLAVQDRLYDSSHTHRTSPKSVTCKDNCGEEKLITRNARGDDDDDPMIHYGLIASSDNLMKDATIRDKLAREEGVLCFEMEAAGLMNQFPCLIIRGICDYSDTHKNDEWQGFAAMTAAAYAKELLQRIPPTKIQKQEPLAKVLDRNSRRQEIERWLKPPRPSTNVAKAKKRRHDGTGLWFIQSPAFAEFKAGSKKHLWLHGLAGCGKTVLSSKILDDLSAMDGIITLVHYFDFNDVEKQSLDGLLRSLAFQLYQHGGQDASAKLYGLFQSCRDGSGDPGESQLEACIKSMISTVNRVFILIDGLDECKSRGSLLSWIGRFTVENVQFLLTARPEDDIQLQVFRCFGEENCLRLDKAAVDGDIKSYVSFVLDTNPTFMEKGLSEELRNEILTKVGDGADGMFRWAACQMDTVEACLTPNSVREALNSLPLDLPMAYELMLESIPPHYKSDSIRLLQFIVNCEHPLSPAEAVEILATRPDQHQDRLKFDPQDRLFKSSNIARYCPGMIHIVLVTDKDVDEESPFHHWEEVHLTHFSVKEYLTERNSSFLPLECAIAITETSLAYLNNLKEPFYRMCADYPLAIRAADIWPAFARTLQSLKVRDQEKELCLVIAIRGKHSRVAEILLAYDVSADASHPSYGPVINNASQLGLEKVVRILIEAGANVNRDRPGEKNYCKPALCAASENGHLKIVEDLLEAGAHVRIHESVRLALMNGHTAIVELLEEKAFKFRPIVIASELLDSAASHGKVELVRRLLDTKPDVLFISRALLGACLAGRTEIVRLLLQYAKADHKVTELGATRPSTGSHNVPNCDEYFGDFLIFAVKSGNEHLVQMLLDNVFDLGRLVDLRHQDFEDPATMYAPLAFVIALKGCHQKVITTLLDPMLSYPHNRDYAALRAASEIRNHHILRNLSVALDGDSSPLSLAEIIDHVHEMFLGDHKHIFQSLLKKAGRNYFQHVKAGFEEWKLPAPVEVAAKIGNVDIVSQLLHADIVSGVDQALDLAFKNGHEHAVRVLLDYMTDKNITMHRSDNHNFWNNYSRRDRSGSIAHMFLDRGMDYNCIFEYGNTLLHRAAEYGNVNLVERLLSLGHAVDPENKWHCTPLHGASSIDVKPVLLAAGANVNAFGNHGLTPLHDAAQRGVVEEMELLLESGASISALTEYGWTVLDEALSYEKSSDSTVLRTVKFLLDRGLSANDKNGNGAIPLHNACATSRVDAAALLIRKGADVNARDNRGKTPFQWASRGFVSKATVDLLSMLVDHGADVNSQDYKGLTALHDVDLNIRTDYPGIFSLLVDYGADVNSQNYKGFAALHHVDLNGGNDDTDLNYQHHLADMAELLLDYGVDIDARDKEGKTALYWFFERGQLAAAEILIKRGADVKALGDYGETMLRAINDNTLSFPRA
ncbi:multiple ankyrin repeats single kh domain protein [Fusarium sp. NRRL 52700]|nr:multiple ankyrin repeats single kh domain protein [Fusarium sp. NRRL 52700]